MLLDLNTLRCPGGLTRARLAGTLIVIPIGLLTISTVQRGGAGGDRFEITGDLLCGVCTNDLGIPPIEFRFLIVFLWITTGKSALPNAFGVTFGHT